MLSLSRQIARQSRVAVRALATVTSSTFGDQRNGGTWVVAVAALVGAAAGTATVLNEEAKYRVLPQQKYASPSIAPIPPKDSHIAAQNNPPPRPDLPIIPLDDVSEHNDESSLWFTYRGAVYDMTFFLFGHPGGTPVS
jgi:hypothetical protein